jgi:hypothetical protein
MFSTSNNVLHSDAGPSHAQPLSCSILHCTRSSHGSRLATTAPAPWGHASTKQAVRVTSFTLTPRPFQMQSPESRNSAICSVGSITVPSSPVTSHQASTGTKNVVSIPSLSVLFANNCRGTTPQALLKSRGVPLEAACVVGVQSSFHGI